MVGMRSGKGGVICSSPMRFSCCFPGKVSLWPRGPSSLCPAGGEPVGLRAVATEGV